METGKLKTHGEQLGDKMDLLDLQVETHVVFVQKELFLLNDLIFNYDLKFIIYLFLIINF
jgi:hypothetical protein